MITVTIRANGVPREVQALPTQVINDFLLNNGIDTSRTAIFLNGNSLTPSMGLKTFADAGITGNALISSVVKTANA